VPSKGIKTIGYGHACFTAAQCSQIHPPITEAQGEKLLQEDLIRFESCVEGKAPGLPDNKFAAVSISNDFNEFELILTSINLKYSEYVSKVGIICLQFGLW
jgi:hypothetical protein